MSASGSLYMTEDGDNFTICPTIGVNSKQDTFQPINLLSCHFDINQ